LHPSFWKGVTQKGNVTVLQIQNAAGDEMRDSNRCILILGLIIFGASVMLGAVAQEPGQQPTPPQQAPASDQHYQTENPEQFTATGCTNRFCTQTLSLASILAASADPSQIAAANDFLAARQNFTPEQIASDPDKQSWAPAVKSLLAFPPVVRNLSSNLSWTSELGDAYYKSARRWS